jgi:hypothetical protein
LSIAFTVRRTDMYSTAVRDLAIGICNRCELRAGLPSSETRHVFDAGMMTLNVFSAVRLMGRGTWWSKQRTGSTFRMKCEIP